ncbi:MAG: co-chaperone DjlA [Gammaproteobacteria bacterium]|nr:co-chaperone DjlA [Gammaproteobacteria bacterium]MCZ6880873.1 co-chaperone DjlA [Gammaproteobacteria bacterium]
MTIVFAYHLFGLGLKSDNGSDEFSQFWSVTVKWIAVSQRITGARARMMPGALIGKLIGGFIGLIFGGPIGFLIGVYLGHQFDRGFVRTGGIKLGGLNPQRARETFVRTTFQVMGHMAKADGQVSEQEIHTARNVMRQMRMTPEQVTEAIAWFTEGKRPDFPLRECLRRFRQFSLFHAGLTRAFVELQVQAAMIGNGMHPDEREILWMICQELGVSRAELAQIEELVGLHMGGSTDARSPADELARSYKVLGVAEDASDRDFKTAYRRLMNQHHPDKLVAKGLPAAMMDEAKVKVREIRAAYDLIKKNRGLH